MKKILHDKLNILIFMLVLCTGLLTVRVQATGAENTTAATTTEAASSADGAESSSTEPEAVAAPTSTQAPIARYTVTVIGGHASVSEAEPGTSVEISNPDISDGEVFVRWELTGVSPNVSTEQRFTFMMPAENVTVKLVKETPIYSIKVEGGTSSVSEAKAGEKITVTAVIGNGESFDYWEITDKNGTTKEYKRILNLTMPDSDLTCILHKKYQITVEGGKASSVEEQKPSSILWASSDEKISVSPHEESVKGFFAWVISGLEGEDVSYEETFTFTMPAQPVSFKAQFGGKVTIEEDLGTAFPAEAQEKTEVTISQPRVPAGQVFDYWEIEGVKSITRSEEEIFTFTMPPNDVRITLHWKAAETETVPETAPPMGYYYIDRYRIHKLLTSEQAPQGFQAGSDSGTFTDTVEAFYSSSYRIYVYVADRGTDDTADLYVYDAYNTSLIRYTYVTDVDGKELIVTTPLNKRSVPGNVQTEAKVTVSSDGTEKTLVPGFVTVSEAGEKLNVVYLCDPSGKRDYYVVYTEDEQIRIELYDDYMKTHVPETESEAPSSSESEAETVPSVTEGPSQSGEETPGTQQNPYLFWIILVGVILFLVILAIILVVYFNRKQEDEELETDFDEPDPKEAFELFNRVKERDRTDSDYNPNAIPGEDFNVSFENAFPAEMGIAAAVREVDDEEDMPKKFTNDYPMQEIEDITDEIVKLSAAEILAGDTQRIEPITDEQEATARAAEGLTEAETAGAESEPADNKTEAIADDMIPETADQTVLGAVEVTEAAEVSGTVEETGTESVPETVEKAVEAAEDTVTETAETAADVFIPAADAIEEAAVSAEKAINETADDTKAAIETAESAAEAVIAEDPAITRLKSHLSVGIKSDEEIARERSLKKVTYKDILQEEDFEEINLKNAQQEKE